MQRNRHNGLKNHVSTVFGVTGVHVAVKCLGRFKVHAQRPEVGERVCELVPDRAHISPGLCFWRSLGFVLRQSTRSRQGDRENQDAYQLALND